MRQLAIALFASAALASAADVVVSVDGKGDFKTIAEALAAGRTQIRINPGTYREHLIIDKPSVQLRGLGKRPEDVVITYDLSAGTSGGTRNSASVAVTGDDFLAENITFENSFTRTHPQMPQGSQAVAVKVSGDRAIFRRVRFLGHQDTLYAGSNECEADRAHCRPVRQYFEDCYIEGNVDFICGDALAFFERCEIHAVPHSVVMLTAQSKHSAEHQSGYVFDHCRITADPGAPLVYLGRPWRAWASVVFMNTEMPAEVNEQGWREWEHDGKPSLPTAFYAEYNSTGPGARPKTRRQLTKEEAARYALPTFLAGTDHWDPRRITEPRP